MEEVPSRSSPAMARKEVRMRHIRIVVIAVAATLGFTLFASPASANTGSIEKWEASWTDQCTKASLCGTEFLGGEWGHGVFTRDDATGATTGEVEVVFAFHNVQGSGALLATSHLKTHILSWSVGAGFDAGVPNIVFDDYYSTFTGGLGLFFDGPLGGPPVDSAHCFIGCPLYTEIPAVPGHYNGLTFFGVPDLPGHSYVSNVVKIS
jgi:hypothetical protein